MQKNSDFCKKFIMRKIILGCISLFLFLNLNAQDKKQLDWYNKDLKKDKIFGVSTEKAYQELLKNKKPQTVIVAVIDGGTDVNHEDLQGMIWTNPGEIAGNGIDDDKNGYIDDIHGWNFIGGSDGQNVAADNLELTRLYKELNEKYGNADSKKMEGNPEFKLYFKIKQNFLSKYNNAKRTYMQIGDMTDKAMKSDSIIRVFLKKDHYTIKEIKKVKTSDIDVSSAVNNILYWNKQNVSIDDLKDYKKQVESEYLYQYNVDFDPRSIVGDNYKDNSNPYYGNNDVVGPRPSHGTFVAGNIAAVRKNGKGADGVAANVQLMIIRVVPDGDERDKDVANGILYAMNNGAKVINMSFGKLYSPQKHFVDSVVRLAESKDVLLVHAAGNDAENNDVVIHYPENLDKDNKPLTGNWLSVGASTMKADKNLPARFSNYGAKSVDVFAPGHDLWGLEPQNKYGSASGTSMAAPVVSGVASVIRSYYPELSATQVREIIVKSVTKFDKEVLLPNETGVLKLVPFSSLSVSGGIVNLYQALLMAEEMVNSKK